MKPEALRLLEESRQCPKRWPERCKRTSWIGLPLTGIKVNSLNIRYSICLFSLWFLFCSDLVFCLAYTILHVSIINTSEQEGMFEGADEQQGHMRSIICCAELLKRSGRVWKGRRGEVRKCVLVSSVAAGGRLKGWSQRQSRSFTQEVAGVQSHRTPPLSLCEEVGAIVWTWVGKGRLASRGLRKFQKTSERACFEVLDCIVAMLV